MPWSSAPWRTISARPSQLARQRFADARASLGKAIAKDPTDWHLWLDLAPASTGRPRIRALDRARLLNPLSPDLASSATGAEREAHLPSERRRRQVVLADARGPVLHPRQAARVQRPVLRPDRVRQERTLGRSHRLAGRWLRRRARNKPAPAHPGADLARVRTTPQPDILRLAALMPVRTPVTIT
jgi:hypothetical protein